MVRRSVAWHGRIGLARQGKARQGMARQGKAEINTADEKRKMKAKAQKLVLSQPAQLIQ